MNEYITASGIVVCERSNKTNNSQVIEYTKQHQEADAYLNSVINASTAIFSRGGSGGSFGISPDGKRDFNVIFGYGTDLSYADYKGMFERGGIAGTVVSKVAKACWRDMPEIKLNDKPILVDELLKLKRIKLFKSLENADICNRIGKYSVLFVGVPDGLDPKLPIGSAAKDNYKGLYFNAYEEDGIEVLSYDTDPASPRYNMPELYQLQSTSYGNSTLAKIATSRVVHYSRVVHMAEGALSCALEGMSSLQQPFNALTDKEKTRGSGAESFYRGSRQKLALEAENGTKIDTREGATEKLKENIENFQNGFEDTLRLRGMKANMLQPGVASPRDQFDVCVEEIAGTTGIPVRILTTKAGGSVTGSEDKATWNALVRDRQYQECTGYLLDALQILSDAGILNLPEDVDADWGEQSALSEKEASEVCNNKASAFKSAVDGLSTMGADELVAESVFKEIGLDGIEIDDIDLSEDDDKLNKSLEE